MQAKSTFLREFSSIPKLPIVILTFLKVYDRQRRIQKKTLYRLKAQAKFAEILLAAKGTAKPV